MQAELTSGSATRQRACLDGGAPSSRKFFRQLASVLWPQKNRLFLRAFDFDAVRLDAGIILERVMNDAAVKRAQRFQFHHVAPAADFFSGVLRLFDERFARLGAVT